MPPSPAQRRLPLLLAVLIPLGTLVGGCAQFPRIDPSGERFLIWPGPAAASPALGALSAIPTNQVAPPVFGSGGGGSLCPLCPLGGCPLGGCGLAAPLTNTVGRPTLPEQLRITPERILAPVGSEVVLKAGVCADTGYLRTNRRIEWMLNPQGTGQFVTIGEQGEMDILRAPWQRPKKFDNTYAVGYTSPFHTCVNRGTSDPSDDTQIRPGRSVDHCQQSDRRGQLHHGPRPGERQLARATCVGHHLLGRCPVAIARVDLGATRPIAYADDHRHAPK